MSSMGRTIHRPEMNSLRALLHTSEHAISVDRNRGRTMHGRATTLSPEMTGDRTDYPTSNSPTHRAILDEEIERNSPPRPAPQRSIEFDDERKHNPCPYHRQNRPMNDWLDLVVNEQCIHPWNRPWSWPWNQTRIRPYLGRTHVLNRTYVLYRTHVLFGHTSGA